MIRERFKGVILDQLSNALLALATAKSTSSAEESPTLAMIFPEAGLKTSDVRPLDILTVFPSI
jgi:hypothetical protein